LYLKEEEIQPEAIPGFWEALTEIVSEVAFQINTED
jgi:hypothetical protein